MSRLLGLGSIVVDLVLTVAAVPEPGGDVLATTSTTAVGGGRNVLVAATLAGLPSAYGGGHGTGPFGDLVRAALAADGIPALLGPSPQEDTGFCVVLVDATGERTFATTVGAEGRLTAEQLGALDVRTTDHVYVSGYDLAYPHATTVAAAVSGLPAGCTVLLDPGPLVAELDAAVLGRVLQRTTWVSLNTREAALWSGRPDPGEAAVGLLDAHEGLAGVVVRDGADGCIVATRTAGPVRVPGVPVERVLDSNGAGDVHTGTFLAGLATGVDPVAAAARANTTAAWSVTRTGPGLGRTDG